MKQEIYRKLGYAIQADEEQLRVQLEAIQAELNAPTQFKVSLRALLSLSDSTFTFCLLSVSSMFTQFSHGSTYTISSSSESLC